MTLVDFVKDKHHPNAQNKHHNANNHNYYHSDCIRFFFWCNKQKFGNCFMISFKNFSSEAAVYKKTVKNLTIDLKFILVKNHVHFFRPKSNFADKNLWNWMDHYKSFLHNTSCQCWARTSAARARETSGNQTLVCSFLKISDY